MKKLLVFIFAIVIAVSSCTQTDSKIKTDTEYSTAYVNEFTGECILIRKGFETGLPLEDLYIPLYEGDTLTTGADSRLEVVFDDTTVLKLDPNCSLVIKKLFRAEKNETIIELIKGRVTAIVKKLTENEEFKVKTKMAMAAVKGTEFIVDANDEDTVAVFEGAVEVSGLDIQGNVIEKIIVKKEQETVITKKTRKPSHSKRFRKDFESRHQEIGELRGRIEQMRALRHSGGAHEFKKERWKKRNEYIREQRKQERGSFDFNRGDRRSREDFRYDSRGNRYERRSRAMEPDGFRDKRTMANQADMREENKSHNNEFRWKEGSRGRESYDKRNREEFSGMNKQERGMKQDNRRREENARDDNNAGIEKDRQERFNRKKEGPGFRQRGEERINKEEQPDREDRVNKDRQGREKERGEEKMERQNSPERNEERFTGDNRERGKRPGLNKGGRDRAAEERLKKEESGAGQENTEPTREEEISNEESTDNKRIKRWQGQRPQRENKKRDSAPEHQETPVENTQIQQEPETEEGVEKNDRRGERQSPSKDRKKARDDKEEQAVEPENTVVSSQPEAVTQPAEEETKEENPGREKRGLRQKR